MNTILISAIISFLAMPLIILVYWHVNEKIVNKVNHVLANLIYSLFMFLASIAYVFGTILIGECKYKIIANFSSFICAVMLIIIIKLTNGLLSKILYNSEISIQERVKSIYTALIGAVLAGTIIAIRENDFLGVTMMVPSIALATILGFSISLDDLVSEKDIRLDYRQIPKKIFEWIKGWKKQSSSTYINLGLFFGLICFYAGGNQTLVSDVGTGVQ